MEFFVPGKLAQIKINENEITRKLQASGKKALTFPQSSRSFSPYF